MTNLPVALTCGEPAGIGPEITVKAWEQLRDDVPFFLIGDPRHLPEGTPWKVIETPMDALEVVKDHLPILPINFETPRIAGELQIAHASGVIRSIELAVELTRAGLASAVCTNPINKKALKDGADFPYPGHTEFLAALGDNADVVMMLASDDLKVVPATIHIPLAEVPTALTQDTLVTCLRVTHRAMVDDFGVRDPKIAVAGLNPHAGEGGAMGTEDAAIIAPVLEQLRDEGMHLTGPLPADTMFHDRARADYDVAVCMYHDQALIPIKTLAFDKGVNVTLGLPFVRTSPDHGTALNIAGKNIADPSSLVEALRLAAEMGRKRKR